MLFEPEKVVSSLRAAGEPNRLRILALLRHGDLAVGELVQIMGQSQPRLSHHLKALTNAGLVDRLPEGSWVFYSLPTHVNARHIVLTVLDLIDVEAGDFGRDAANLKRVRAERSDAAETYFSEMADTWDTVRSLHYPNKAIEKALLDIAGPGPFARLVDIGTGTGRMLSLFADRVGRADGVDLSHRMLTVARANLQRDGTENAFVRQADATVLPFDDASVDLVIIHQVLHFIEEPDRALAEAARILKPDGRLLIVDFAPHQLEFLREKHGHRRLGVRHDTLAEWAANVGLGIDMPRRFEPPKDLKEGLAVEIWTATYLNQSKEAAE
ncbi:MAG: metalloregulator ArsR/SmtB family transcription factor [Pseudomonadota bacterium]